MKIVVIFRILFAALLMSALPLPSFAGIFLNFGVTVGTPPPPIPYYAQPFAPVPNEIWTPGYWAWGPGGYYWVPGTWVFAPQFGMLWTPGYWAWTGNAYGWYPGYWARRVGFYGGVNYGYGYFGNGYVGGMWRGREFRYNTAVTNVNTTIIRSVYVNRTVVNNYDMQFANRVSYNGGRHGLQARPTPLQQTIAKERHFGLTRAQRIHLRFASHDRNQLASVNHGHPAQTAVAHPFSAMHRPATFAPLTARDRANARAQVIRNAKRNVNLHNPRGQRVYRQNSEGMRHSQPHPRHSTPPRNRPAPR